MITGRGNGSLHDPERSDISLLSTRPPADGGCPCERTWFSSSGSSSTATTTVSVVDEPRHVVDVAVRVVADAPFAEPDRLANPQPFLEQPLVVLAGQTWVADLDVGQQPLFGRQQKPLTVDLDAAPFEHDALTGIGAARLFASHARDARHGRSDACIEMPVGILRPPVERPVQKDHLAGGIDDGCRGGIAQPDAVGGDLVQPDPFARGPRAPRARDRAPSMTSGLWQRISTRFVIGQHAGDLRVHPGIGPSFPGQSGSWCGQLIHVAR